jgi:glycosyltransferase involved in cell wall biosynthesis
MISICIPVFNFKVDGLVKNLYTQAELLEVPAEIILIDDCSEKFFREYNEKTCDHVKYIGLDKNIGRASIRNLFLTYSNHDYLLFLDCDSMITRDNFLVNYIDAIRKYPDSVICGGREYHKLPPPRNKRLRWKYGIRRECKPAEIRVQNPYKSFMTNNFVISKKVLESVKFDERLAEYGHEDTLFGYELKKREINIHHINNPILNGHLEDNFEYLQNTEKAISNLTFILRNTGYNQDLIDDITLLRFYYRFYRWRRVHSFVFQMLKPLIRFTLLKGLISLYVFDFYKLGILHRKLLALPYP